jgi:uncharacterized SAM-binding protein YcdF (DUF218 family)
MVDLWTKAAGILLTPPGVIIVFALLGLLLQIRWRIAGIVVVALAIGALYVLSLPGMGVASLASLERAYTPVPVLTTKDIPNKPQAIVVLGGGRYSNATEYGGDTVSSDSLERIRYTAYLARQTHLPVLTSGGAPFGEGLSEALLMARVLEQEFGIKPRWLEEQSRTTRENAELTRAILRRERIERIYLVTHAWHMPRAMYSFSVAGVDVVPAPFGFHTLSAANRTYLGLLPSSHGLSMSSIGIRERIGLLWYKSKSFAPTSASPTSKPES